VILRRSSKTITSVLLSVLCLYLLYYSVIAFRMFGGEQRTLVHVESLVAGGGIGECSSRGEPIPKKDFDACFNEAEVVGVLTDKAEDPLFDQYRVALKCKQEAEEVQIEIIMSRGGGKPWCAHTKDVSLLPLSQPPLQNVVPPEYPLGLEKMFRLFSWLMRDE
jgi:hypothetical protein